MEYKYSTINEVNHFEFGEAVVGDIQLTERMFHLVLDNVKICPENSCNRDIRMMRTNELLFKISDAEIISLVEEGYNEYDADGNLKHTYPDEEVEKAKYDEVAFIFAIVSTMCFAALPLFISLSSHVLLLLWNDQSYRFDNILSVF